MALKEQNLFALAPRKGMRLAGLLNGQLHVAGNNVNSLNWICYFNFSNECATTILFLGEKFFLDLKDRYDENYNRSYGADFMNQSWTSSSGDTDPILYSTLG